MAADVRPPLETLPAAPLLTAIGDTDLNTLCRGDENFRRAIHRAKADGRITVTQADRICVEVLHVHPADIWGDAWYAVSEVAS